MLLPGALYSFTMEKVGLVTLSSLPRALAQRFDQCGFACAHIAIKKKVCGCRAQRK